MKCAEHEDIEVSDHNQKQSAMLFAAQYPGRYYVNFYVKYFSNFWENLTPAQYGGLLIFIAVCGYLLMKSSR